MAKKIYIVEIFLADKRKNFTQVEAETPLEAIDKVYEHYKKRNVRVYDLKIVE